MMEDLQLHGFAAATQRAYLHAVHQLAAHYHKSPALLTEEELRAYFLHLTRVQKCAPGTLKIALAGIRFCLGLTLQRRWPTLGLLEAGVSLRLIQEILGHASPRAAAGRGNAAYGPEDGSMSGSALIKIFFLICV
jgi:hypothetical protein